MALARLDSLQVFLVHATDQYSVRGKHFLLVRGIFFRSYFRFLRPVFVAYMGICFGNSEEIYVAEIRVYSTLHWVEIIFHDNDFNFGRINSRPSIDTNENSIS